MTLVLVHGAGCDHHAWDEVTKHVGDVAVLAVDLPGRGGDGRAPRTTPAAAAEAVLQELERRGVPASHAVVVGHSYGGAVAIECALATSLAGLVLVSTGARLRVHPLVLAAMRANAAAGPRTGAAVGWRPGADAARIAHFDACAALVPSATTLADWLAADGFDRMNDVARIATPTLVIGGSADELTRPKYARYLATTIPGAELALLEGTGHMCIVEDAERIAPLLTAFARRLAP